MCIVGYDYDVLCLGMYYEYFWFGSNWYVWWYL